VSALEPAAVESAARAMADAEGLLIGAGAGMGVDSGLPDFRGDTGFWEAYPPFERAGLRFVDMANPTWFERDPELAWGFYGHRLKLYRSTLPHPGFEILRRWGEACPAGHFVFTSNVDGQFQKAGFSEEHIVECHGSIHYLQCSTPCHEDIWHRSHRDVDFDPLTFRASPPLPTCPRCSVVSRPNVLMFGDFSWLPRRTFEQERRFKMWLNDIRDARLVIIELGAGSAVPTVRWNSESTASTLGATLIRINPREAHVPRGQIGLAGPALATLEAIEETLATTQGGG
jgi:NAD-dependent SIR2 family protein deacetylase